MRASMDRHDNFNPMEVHVSMDGQTRFNSIETSASIGWMQRPLPTPQQDIHITAIMQSGTDKTENGSATFDFGTATAFDWFLRDLLLNAHRLYLTDANAGILQKGGRIPHIHLDHDRQSLFLEAC